MWNTLSSAFAAMELSDLDFSEFLAAYESMTLALASHVRELAPYREVH